MTRIVRWRWPTRRLRAFLLFHTDHCSISLAFFTTPREAGGDAGQEGGGSVFFFLYRQSTTFGASQGGHAEKFTWYLVPGVTNAVYRPLQVVFGWLETSVYCENTHTWYTRSSSGRRDVLLQCEKCTPREQLGHITYVTCDSLFALRPPRDFTLQACRRRTF